MRHIQSTTLFINLQSSSTIKKESEKGRERERERERERKSNDIELISVFSGLGLTVIDAVILAF